MNFNSHTDAVVQAAAGLVNALTEGERRGRPYTPPPPAELAADVTGVLRGVSRRVQAGESEMAELAAVARRLRAVFEAIAAGDVDGAAGQVNRMLEETQARPRLERHDGEPWHVHFHGTGGSFADDWAGPCATGLAVVIGGELHDRLGVCTAPHCDRVYVDTSRNGARRFCSTACQNRVKTAAFRARAHTG
ncbi:CGNR zinc finger domain-containing protein [Actinomadura rubrisoli]|uniref:CGNR zinc finger domain-containing protein n=1 Tax=Actinomadura rubrisoli TaxID=2530368 RepID=A0A4V2YVN9_9ACTN|nr:CGNR zinc finger domain-containing protein [Actinomadura rubrisoli]TDD82277.1 CGNR zinc finger domain-containing protein [Actinomadura rubrisoli]